MDLVQAGMVNPARAMRAQQLAANTANVARTGVKVGPQASRFIAGLPSAAASTGSRLGMVAGPIASKILEPLAVADGAARVGGALGTAAGAVATGNYKDVLPAAGRGFIERGLF